MTPSFSPGSLSAAEGWHPSTVMDGAALFAGLPGEDDPSFEALAAFARRHRSAVLASLPWIAAEIAGNEGFAVMFRFVRARGGQRLYVSAEPGRCAIALGIPIGATTHRRVIAGAGLSGVVDVPSAWGVFLALRRVGIDEALRQGAGRIQVAHAFGVTARSLRGKA